jgi:hypothetical protein
MTDSTGRLTGRFEIEILEHRIVEGVSLYILSRFPLRGEEAPDDAIAVRFDSGSRQYLYIGGEYEGALFPSSGVAGEVVETDAAGLPRVVRLAYADRTLTLERGFGITGAIIETSRGQEMVTLLGARVGNEVVGEAERLPTQPVFRIAPPADNVVLPADAEPVLELEATPLGGSHRFVLRVLNPGGRLMAFDFATSQSYDFVVTDPDTGAEVWRWAQRQFFSRQVRSEAIRADGQWTFEEEWNHRNLALEPGPPRSYQVHGVLTSERRFESPRITIEVD